MPSTAITPGDAALTTRELEEQVLGSIVVFRGLRVMVDRDLAALYGVETRALNQSVRRNITRFPHDFMFQLTAEEAAELRSQNGISNSQGGRRYAPHVFTEQGVAMLSSVLNSPRAIQVNIEIMRAFVRLRSFAASHAALAQKLDELENRYDRQFASVFEAIRKLMTPPPPSPARRSRIGFKTGDPAQ